MNHKPDPTQTVLQWWRILRRYRWRFIVAAFCGCATVLALSFMLPHKYRATAIFERHTDMVLTEITDHGATQSFQNPRGSLVEEVTGAPAVDQLLQTLGPKLRTLGLIHNDAELAALRGRLLHGLVVHWDISSSQLDRVRLEYTGFNPDVARLVVNGIVDHYIEHYRQSMSDRLTNSIAFFKAQVKKSHATIGQLDNNVLAFEIAHHDLLPGNPQNVQVQLAEARKQLGELMSQRAAAATQIKALNDALKTIPNKTPTLVTAPNPRLTQLHADLQDLLKKRDLDINVYKMTPAHPDLIALDKQIAGLKETIAGTKATVVTERQVSENPNHNQFQLQLTQAQAQYDALSTQAAAMQQTAAELKKRSKNLFPMRSDYQKMKQKVADAETQLAFWQSNLHRVLMTQAAETSGRGVQLIFIKPAAPSNDPVSPNLAQVFMAAVLIGLLVAVICVVMTDRTDTAFRSADEASTACDLPLLGAVSELIGARQRHWRMLRRYVFAPLQLVAMLAILAGLAAGVYLNLKHPELFARLKQDAGVAARQPAQHTGIVASFVSSSLD